MQTTATTALTIRHFDQGDYPRVTELHNLAYIDFAKKVEECRLNDERRPSCCLSQRWVAETEDQLVGYAEYHQAIELYKPGKFRFDLSVDPNYLGKGIGKQLYDVVFAALESLSAEEVETWSRQDMPNMIGFLERRGFAPDFQMFASRLDLHKFEPRRWTSKLDALEAQKVEIRSLEQLGKNDQRVLEKLFGLWADVRQDLPLVPGDEFQPATFETFMRLSINQPSLFPAGYFVAIDGDEFVGVSQLYNSPKPGQLRTGLTGVKRVARRRGIAFGLKVHALGFAKHQGYAEVITDNAAVNRGMLAINRELGFKRNPPWIHYVKHLSR